MPTAGTQWHAVRSIAAITHISLLFLPSGLRVQWIGSRAIACQKLRKKSANRDSIKSVEFLQHRVESEGRRRCEHDPHLRTGQRRLFAPFGLIRSIKGFNKVEGCA